jgi:hypothetical protein
MVEIECIFCDRLTRKYGTFHLETFVSLEASGLKGAFDA